MQKNFSDTEIFLHRNVFLCSMGLFVASLASGSNGNCYYIANETEAVLIDAGILCKELETRMRRLGLEMKKVKAVFISHEHTDHISGLKVISKKHNLPVYITPRTLQNARSGIDRQCIKLFAPGEVVTIGDLSITSFSKSHDAAEPCSFTIAGNGVTVGVFTDIGNVCSQVIESFGGCHAAFLEANYDEEMLEKGSYPFFL
ncbi:MAG: MBL fold metallo-hydrolase, partial [Bacteroidota bacterium]